MAFSRNLFFILCLSLIGATPVLAQVTPLSSEQNLWFDKRNRTILVRPERNNPPFDFVAAGSTGKPQGLAIDYIELISTKIKAKLQYFEPAQRVTILEVLKSGKDGIALALAETPERNDYLYFTKPFISVPAVIVVRKDAPSKKGGFTLNDFSGKRVAIVDSSALESYTKNNYKKVIIEPVSDDEVGLQKLLLGEVDAAAMDIASLSYYTSNKALSYVIIGGQTGYDYNLAFAVPKSTPELQIILNDALASISPQERTIIKDKWITVSSDQSEPAVRNFFSNNVMIIAVIVVGGGLIFLITLIILMRSLRRAQKFTIHDIHKHESAESLHEELKELEEASEAVGDELAQIKRLEEKISEKIKKID